MIQRIRAIERQLACHRAYIVAEPIVETFIETWEQAMDEHARLPDLLDILHAYRDETVAILAIGPINSYLEQCQRDNRVPDAGPLVETIVHGYSQFRLHLTTKCRCLRRA